jgi:hypothetical protein
MPRIKLTTFLFNDSVDSVEKSRRMGKYVSDPGGSDYYWGVAEGAKRLFADEQPYDRAVAALDNITVEHKRQDNKSALLRLYQWKLGHAGFPLPVPVGEIMGPGGELVVTLKPAYAWQTKTQKAAYVLWTYKDVRLTAPLAGIGVYFLEQQLRTGNFSDYDFYLLDLATCRRFGRSAISAGTPRAAMMALKYQEDLYLAAKKGAA